MTSTDMPTALIEQPAQAVVAAQSAKNDWAENRVDAAVRRCRYFVRFVCCGRDRARLSRSSRLLPGLSPDFAPAKFGLQAAMLQATMALHLIIGNKNYSSWSFRPWLALKVAGIAFEETVISLEAKDFKVRVTALSGAGRVPVLLDGDVRIWETLSILEYLAEKFPPPACGRKTLPHALMPAPSLRKCMPGFYRCGGICR